MLDEIIELENHNMTVFKAEYPGLWIKLDAACNKLVETGFYLHERLFSKTNSPVFGEMVLKIHEWIAGAMIHFVSRDYDAAMSLLRMACEHARDLRVLADDGLLFHLWLRYRTERDTLEFEDQKTFRKKFRFDETTKSGAACKSLYDRLSEWGLHGGGIFTGIFRKPTAPKSLTMFSLGVDGLMTLPGFCLEALKILCLQHSSEIEAEFGVSAEDFLLDLEVRYLNVFARALQIAQDVQIEKQRLNLMTGR
jgi:hypothetical protein